MKIAVKTIEGDSAGEIDLADAVFGVPVRKDILQRCVVWQLSRRQQGTHKTKGRSEVTATAKKMYAQKGTGQRPPRQPGGPAVPRRRQGVRSGRAQPRLGSAEEGPQAGAAHARCRPRRPRAS